MIATLLAILILINVYAVFFRIPRKVSHQRYKHKKFDIYYNVIDEKRGQKLLHREDCAAKIWLTDKEITDRMVKVEAENGKKST